MQTLKELRQEMNLSQADLGELAGITEVTISLAECGQVFPTGEVRKRIEGVLGAVDWLQTKYPGFQTDHQLCEAEHILREIQKWINAPDGLVKSQKLLLLERFIEHQNQKIENYEYH